MEEGESSTSKPGVTSSYGSNCSLTNHSTEDAVRIWDI